MTSILIWTIQSLSRCRNFYANMVQGPCFVMYELKSTIFHHRYKTRNTYKRHMKIYHGKVVGPGGNLLSVPKSEVIGDELTVKPPPQQRVIRQRKQDIQPKVELSVAGATSPVQAPRQSPAPAHSLIPVPGDCPGGGSDKGDA